MVSFKIPATVPAGLYAASVSANTGVTFATTSCASLTVIATDPFLKSSGGQLTLNGVPFRFGGGNSYVLMYSPPATVNQILETAASSNFKVVRTWGWIDIGELNGTGSINGPQNGVYFQYWTGTAPAYNDGANGLQMLDYEVYEAGQLGLKLIITLTDNWANFGGMDQYVEWAGDQYHDQFYTDPRIITWYENWVSHVMNRVNTFTGVAYKNDPTIAIWELANEPRCQGSGTSSGGFPTSSSCSTQTLISWISQVAPFVKSVDSNHLVSVGDEGFFCTDPSSTDLTMNCSEGVDSVKFTEAPGIDLMGFHLYPESWGQSASWGGSFITQHLADGQSLGKPVYLGEYGLLGGNTRNTWYTQWTDTMLTQGGEGALFWDLLGGEPGASSAENNGDLDLAQGAPLLITVSNFAQEILANTQLPFAPVADDQWATASFNTAVTLNPIQNDTAYGGASVNSNSIDLDPNTPGQQTTLSAYGGQFAVSGANVVFTPSQGFNGSTQASYTVQDSNGRQSNVAYLNVTVQPSSAGTLDIESFETGTDGWGPLGTSGGTVAQSTMFPTDGIHSLQVNVASAGWFGVSFPEALNLTGRPSLSIDIEATGIGGGAGIAFQSGPSYQWCQSQSFSTLLINSENTLTIPLDPTGATLNCVSGGTPDLASIETVFIYLPGPGTFYLDYLRAAPTVVSGSTIELFSFETGTQGWGAVNAGDATVQQTTAFHTDGNYGLQINAVSGGWVGGSLNPPANVTGATTLSIDLETTSVGTATDISIQTGPNYTWCQGTAFPFVNSAMSTTISIPLDVSQLTCFGDGTLTLSQIEQVNIYINGAGSYYIDNVRAQ
jgi:mannan endo-1,4-beta-mannosidase